MFRRFWKRDPVAQLVEPRSPKPVVGSSTLSGVAINRRQVLAGLLAAPIAVKYFLPPRGGWPVSRYVFETKDLAYRATERFAWGATDVRAIWGTSDGVALTSATHPVGPMSAAAFRAIVEPRLNKIFSEEYDKHSSEWEEVFGSPQLTLLDSLNPDSIEEIEIEIRSPTDEAARLSGILQEERMAIADAGGKFSSDGERSRRLLESILLGFGGKTLK